jgi:hypothetical protein
MGVNGTKALCSTANARWKYSRFDEEMEVNADTKGRDGGYSEAPIASADDSVGLCLW